MKRKTALTLAVICACFLSSEAWGGQGSAAPLANETPSGALAFVEMHGLDKVVDRVEKSGLVQYIQSPAGQKRLQNLPQRKRLAALWRFAEIQMGMDPWSAMKRVLGDRVAVAIYPKLFGAGFDGLVVIRASDPAALASIWERAKVALVLVLDDQFDETTKIEGTPAASIAGKAFAVLMGNSFAIASNRDLLARWIKLKNGKETRSLAKLEAFSSLSKRAGETTLLFGYLDAKKIATFSKGHIVPEKLDNVLASWLFAGVGETLNKSNAAGLVVSVEDQGLSLRFLLDGNPEKLDKAYAAYFVPAGDKNQPLAPVTGQIGSFRLYRDFASLYRQRDRWISEESLAGFDQFETTISNLLPGQNIHQDLLPCLGKKFTIVAALPEPLDKSAGPRIPDFGIVLDAADAEQALDLAHLVYNSFLTITNFESRQRTSGPLIPAMSDYKGVSVLHSRSLRRSKSTTVARSQLKGAKKKNEMMDAAYITPSTYFAPAVARVGRRVILATNRRLCELLIDACQKPPTTKAGANETSGINDGVNEELRIDPALLAKLGQENQEYLAGKLVAAGWTVENAKADLGLARSWLEVLTEINLRGQVSQAGYELGFKVRWK